MFFASFIIKAKRNPVQNCKFCDFICRFCIKVSGFHCQRLILIILRSCLFNQANKPTFFDVHYILGYYFNCQVILIYVKCQCDFVTYLGKDDISKVRSILLEPDHSIRYLHIVLIFLESFLYTFNKKIAKNELINNYEGENK